MIESTQPQPATMPWETAAPIRPLPLPALSPLAQPGRARSVGVTIERNHRLEIALDYRLEFEDLPPEIVAMLQTHILGPQHDAVVRGVGSPVSLASMLLQCGDIDGARKALEHATSGDYMTEHMRAMCFWQSGDLANAEEILRTLSARHPLDHRPLHSLGTLFAEQNRFDDAIVVLRAACKLEPESPVLLNDLGAILIAANRHRDALQVLRLALRLSPRYALALANSGVAHYELQQRTKAADYFKRALAVDARCEVAVHNFAECLLGRKDWDRAAELLRAHLEVSPRDARAHELLAWAYLSSSRLRDALRVLESGLLLRAREPSLLNNLATVYSMLREDSRAQMAFQRAMLLAPDNAQIRANYAHFLGTHNKWEAIVKVLRVRDLDGVSNRASLLAQALLMTNAVEEAIQVLRAARSQFPGELRFALMLGHALASRVGRPNDAVEVYREALTVFDDDLLLNNLGYALILAERCEEAAEVLPPVFQRRRDGADTTSLCVIASYGLLQIRQGRYGDGIALYREALNRASGAFKQRIRQKIYVEEGRHQLELGNLTKAKAALNNARNGLDPEFRSQAEQLLARTLD